MVCGAFIEFSCVKYTEYGHETDFNDSMAYGRFEDGRAFVGRSAFRFYLRAVKHRKVVCGL